MIQYNGVNSRTLGVIVEQYPVRPIPKRKHEIFSVPGRSGDVIVEEDAWENVNQSYDVYLSAERAGLPLVSAQVVRWLNAGGYQRLEDDYNPDIFRLAAFLGPNDLQNILNAFGRATITFNCMPQRFLKSGETAVTPASGETLTNPTGYPAQPLITVSGSGSGTITVGSKTLTISTITDGMVLDCREREAYAISGGVVSNLNTVVSGEYPILGAGDSAVSWTGGVTGLSIIPRWYEL